MNAKNLNLFLTILKFSLVGIGVGVSLFLFNGPNVTDGMDAVEAYREGPQMAAAILFTISVFIACIAIVLIFFVSQLITDTKKTVMAIIGIVVALLIYLVMYSAGTTDTTDTLALRHPVEQGVVNSTTAGIYTTLIGLFIGILVIIIGPFMGRLRK
jgi:hypothetical protein